MAAERVGEADAGDGRARAECRRRFAGKVVAVLGAGSVAPGWSIGRASALQFAREGASVVAVDIDAASVAETVRCIAAEGLDALALVGNVAEEGFVATMARTVLDRFGRVDVLHHNVGVGRPAGPLDFSLEEWRRINDVNVTSLLIACQAFLPAMQERGAGSIVSMSSVSALRYSGIPHFAYSVTKSALLQFVRLIAGQYAPYGIRANIVVPGFIDTPRIAASVAARVQAGVSRDEFYARQNARVPMGRMGTAWEVADAVLFLASDEASYVTGTELVVDGGATLTMRA